MHTNTPKTSLLNPKKKNEECTYERTYSFHGSSGVFYAQSSSQMIRKQGKPDENHGRETTKCRLGKRRPFFSLLSQNTLWWSAHIFIAFCNAFRRYLYLCKKIKILFWFYASSLHHSVYLFRSPLYHSFALRRSIHKLPEKCLSKFETFVKNFHKGRKDTFKQHREETFLPPT